MDPAGGHSTNDVFRETDEAQLELMANNSLRLLDAGITTARDLGCPGTFAVTLRDRIKSKQIMGPRLLVSNGMLFYFLHSLNFEVVDAFG
jgi:imidazolonepropionase-like amidohydrolase